MRGSPLRAARNRTSFARGAALRSRAGPVSCQESAWNAAKGIRARGNSHLRQMRHGDREVECSRPRERFGPQLYVPRTRAAEHVPGDARANVCCLDVDEAADVISFRETPPSRTGGIVLGALSSFSNVRFAPRGNVVGGVCVGEFRIARFLFRSCGVMFYLSFNGARGGLSILLNGKDARHDGQSYCILILDV